jgi:type VI protein secretion system component Hcp
MKCRQSCGGAFLSCFGSRASLENGICERRSLVAVVGGAAGDGKVAMQDFHFVKKMDKASAKLY